MERTSNTIISTSHRLAVKGRRTNTTAIATMATIPTTSITMLIIKRESSARSAPADLPGKRSAAELHIIAATKRERVRPVKRDMVVAPVPDASVDHAVRAERHDGADDGAGNHVVPVVELVDGQRAGDQARAEHGRVHGRQLPESRVVVGEHLELGVQIQSQKNKTRKRSSRVARRHRLERVVDLIRVARADILCIINLGETLRRVSSLGDARVGRARDVGLADRQEMRAQAADQPLDEDLENGGGDQRVQQAQDAVVDVPEGANADLHAQDDEDGDHGGQEGGQPDRDDFLAHRVGELWVDDFAVGELDGEGARGSWVGVVDLLAAMSEYVVLLGREV